MFLTRQAAKQSKRASKDGGSDGAGGVAGGIRTSLVGGGGDGPKATTKAMNNYMGIGIDAKVYFHLNILHCVLRL